MTFAVRDDRKNWHINTSTVPSPSPIYAIQVNGWAFAEETGTATGSSNACTATTTIGHSTGAADPGLTSGDKAGIGVGVAMGVIGLLSLLAGIWMMMRARRRERALVGRESPEYYANHTPGDEGSPMQTSPIPGTNKPQAVTTTGTLSPQSGYRHARSGHTVGGPLGGSASPVELSEERPTELPANPTPGVQS